jgi:hypothetical protein
MFAGQKETAGISTRQSMPRVGVHRLRCAGLLLITALMLSACGGGEDARLRGNFNIGVTVGGQFINDRLVAPGDSFNIAVRAGQSVSVDAGEPVVWTLLVGGTAIRSGVRVYYAGADLVATTLNGSTLVLDTYAADRLFSPISVTLIATSSFDSFQVATVNLLITD